MTEEEQFMPARLVRRTPRQRLREMLTGDRKEGTHDPIKVRTTHKPAPKRRRSRLDQLFGKG